MTAVDHARPPSAAQALLPVLLAQDPERLRALFAGETAGLWLRVAAENDFPRAQVRLGQRLLDGADGMADPAAAAAWFARAARLGDADGANMLGRCLENGWGVRRDAARAAAWYRRAAEAGHAWAQYNLGHLLLNGLGLARDAGEAYAWYRRGAEQGHVRAMNLAGRCLEHGWGVGADRAAARRWYGRSAEGGYFRGQFNFASLLAEDGEIETALPWFAAALSGAPRASRAAMALLLRRSPEPRVRALAGGGAAP